MSAVTADNLHALNMGLSRLQHDLAGAVVAASSLLLPPTEAQRAGFLGDVMETCAAGLRRIECLQAQVIELLRELPDTDDTEVEA